MRRLLTLAVFGLGCGSGGNETGAGAGAGAGASGTGSSTTDRASNTGARSSSSSSTGTPSEPLPDGCTCTDDPFCELRHSPDCGGEELCPTVRLDCARPKPYYGCIGQDVFIDDQAMTCALDALSTRTPGWFETAEQDLTLGSCGLEGCEVEVRRVQITGAAAAAVVSACRYAPFENEACISARQLETPAYFQACKDRPSDGAKLDCLLDGLISGGPLECP